MKVNFEKDFKYVREIFDFLNIELLYDNKVLWFDFVGYEIRLEKNAEYNNGDLSINIFKNGEQLERVVIDDNT
tara:strand:+ start:58 stop:276 length:219 start_codon:yes stop_codon:yes gene_type:complete